MLCLLVILILPLQEIWLNASLFWLVQLNEPITSLDLSAHPLCILRDNAWTGPKLILIMPLN